MLVLLVACSERLDPGDATEVSVTLAPVTTIYLYNETSRCSRTPDAAQITLNGDPPWDVEPGGRDQQGDLMPSWPCHDAASASFSDPEGPDAEFVLPSRSGDLVVTLPGALVERSVRLVEPADRVVTEADLVFDWPIATDVLDMSGLDYVSVTTDTYESAFYDADGVMIDGTTLTLQPGDLTGVLEEAVFYGVWTVPISCPAEMTCTADGYARWEP